MNTQDKIAVIRILTWSCARNRTESCYTPILKKLCVEDHAQSAKLVWELVAEIVSDHADEMAIQKGMAKWEAVPMAPYNCGEP